LLELTDPDQAGALYDALTPAQRMEIQQMLTETQPVWVPLADKDGHPSPQRLAAESLADILLYGGAAGGGKTDLALGLAVTKHHRTLYVRREGTQLEGAKDRLAEILGTRDGFNSQTGVWRLNKLAKAIRQSIREDQIRFAGVPNPGDEWKYQGNPRDLMVLDEAANLLEAQVRALMGWVRDAGDPSQRQRVLMCSNPPTDAEGRWLIKFFAPWLDPDHPRYPTPPGDLRWCAMLGDEDLWVDGPEPFVFDQGRPLYEFEPSDYSPEEIIHPMSRTFIPSRVTDNPYLVGTGYMRTLQALPEPLRSQMLMGDFLAGMTDDAYQVIPTAWVKAAQARWKDRSDEFDPGPMDSMGVDCSRGGPDKSVISRRHSDWYDRLISKPGSEIPDGPTLGAQVLMHRRDAAPVHVDAIGIGSSVVDFLQTNAIQNIPVAGSEGSSLRDRIGYFKFKNKRAEDYWLFREALDPQYNSRVALPPDGDSNLAADLCAAKYVIRDGNWLLVESKDDIKKRIGRSTDDGDAVLLASNITMRRDIQVRDSRHGGHKPRVKRAMC
jgi:hypothetical protein